MGLKMLAAKKKEKKRLNWNLSEDTSDILTWFYVQPTILIEQRGRENGWALNDTINLSYHKTTNSKFIIFRFCFVFFSFSGNRNPSCFISQNSKPFNLS